MIHNCKGLLSSAVEQLIRNEQVAGSNPVGGSILICMKNLAIGGVLLLFFFIGSCGQQTSDPYPLAESLYTPLYAQGFQLKKEGDLRILYVKKSWLEDDQNTFAYTLYPRSDALLHKGKEGHIPYPITRAVCLSTTHVAYLEKILQREVIKGVSGAQYLSNPLVKKEVMLGAIMDVGYEGALNYEALLSLHPDVVFAYGIAGTSSAYLKPLAQMGVPVVFMGDYLESHPLGKAEYMVAFSAFFDSDVMEMAVGSFTEICEAYHHLLALLHSSSPRVKVLLNAPFKDVWYIPGGDNYMAMLLADAGGVALGSRAGVKESRGISLEQVYQYALEADYWLHPNAFRNLNTLAESDARFAQIPAFKAGCVYNNTLRSTPGGGSDFWESGVTEPHIILSDLIKILHPELLPEYQLVYYERLE